VKRPRAVFVTRSGGSEGGGKKKSYLEVAMRLSARNILRGKIKELTHGAVNSEVIIEIPGGTQIVSIITKKSAEDLGLKVGEEAYAFFKATNVMIAKD
jgi:molybdopterin-binding protein